MNIKTHINDLCCMLQEHQYLINSHTNDFITHELWKEFESSPLNENIDQFLHQCNSLSSLTCCYGTTNNEKCCQFCMKDQFKEVDNESTIPSAENSFLSYKKSHEITILANVIHSVAQCINTNEIVDLGSGKGYLGRHLCNNLSYKVVGIESSNSCSQSAQLLQSKITKSTSQKNLLSISNLKTLNYEVIDDMDNGVFTGLIKRSFNKASTSGNNSVVLAGLHACGDLTPNALKLFITENYFSGLVMVGCCYNLLTTGFPLSSYLKNKDFEMTKNALMLACQCPVKWKSSEQSLSKSLLYRAIFEEILFKRNLCASKDFPEVRFRRIGQKSVNFEDYVSRMCERITKAGYEFHICEEERKAEFDKHQHTWPNIQKYHWVRMQLAPCIESLILLDRLMFLIESGCRSYLVKLFSKEISPRCYALVCVK